MPNNVIGVPSTESINDLNDVNITSVQVNDTLCWNGTNFVNVPKANQDQALTDHTDVVITTPTTGQEICFDGTNWVNQDKPAPFVLGSVADHTDVTFTGLADNDTLCYNSATSQWENVPKASGIPAHSITDHTDVDTTGVTDNQVLCYDNATSSWLPVDKITSVDDLTDVNCPAPVAGDALFYDGTQFVCLSATVANLFDVTLTGLADGQQLCYDSATSMWVNVDKETNKCCLPDPGGLSVLDPVYISAAGVVTPSDISDPETIGQFVVVSTDGTEVCIQDFGVVDLGTAHGFTVGDCVFEDAAGGTTTTQPTTGINNVLFHAISATKVSIVSGTRAFNIGSPASTDLDDLADVVLTAPADNDTICYNSATSQWENTPKATSTSIDPQYLRAQKTSTQSLANVTGVPVIYNSVVSDVNGNYDATTGQYTVPETGIYQITGNAALLGTTANTGRFFAGVRKNGAPFVHFNAVSIEDSSNEHPRAITSSTLELVAGDTISIGTFQNSGGTVDLLAEGDFTVVRLY